MTDDTPPEGDAPPGELPSDPAVRLRHAPALDGLRGLAVAAVVAFHLGRLRGGFLGVDLFFVLSGYLITSLLIEEWDRRGTVDLAHFWARRARRLLPALSLLLVGVGVLVATFGPAADHRRLRADGLATLWYAANWHRAAGHASYWDLFRQPSALDHTWSLAIEEQFYLVWPLVFVVAVRRRARGRLVVVTAVGAAVSCALLAAWYDPASTNRAYYGTDTRVGAIFAGALLAMVRRPTGAVAYRRPSVARQGIGLAALVFMAWSAADVDGQAAWYYHGGLVCFAAAAIVVIAVAVGEGSGPLAKLLAWRPLGALGRISYGVYLWHWPAIVYLTEERTHLRGAGLDALRIAVTLAVALASARLIEQPIRAGALHGAAGRIGVAAATLACLAVILATTMPNRRAEVEARGGLAPVATDPMAPITTAPAPTDGAPGSTRLLVVGDSGPLFLRAGLARAAEAERMAVLVQGEFNCSVLFPGAVSRLRDGRLVPGSPGCLGRIERWRSLVRRFDPDIILYYLAYAGGSSQAWLGRHWVADCDWRFDHYLRAALDREMDLLSSGGAKLAIATTPYIKWRPAAAADREVDCRNRVYRQAAQQHPGARILDLNRFVRQTELRGVNLHLDLVHLSVEGGATASGWMLPQLERLAGCRWSCGGRRVSTPPPARRTDGGCRPASPGSARRSRRARAGTAARPARCAGSATAA